MCGEDGDLIWAFKLWLCDTLKEAIHSKPYVSKLESGEIVLRLTSDPEEEEEDAEDSHAPEADLFRFSRKPHVFYAL